MPYHPKIEFALNRISILPDAATDEMKLLQGENFEDLLKISVDSISDPKKFKKTLDRERRDMIRQKQQQQEQQQEGQKDKQQDLISLSVRDLDQQFVQDDDEDDSDEESDEDDKNTKIEIETTRIRSELKNMSHILLDSLQMSIEVVGEKEKEQEQEQEEPNIRISNICLLRFVLTMLSDSLLANTLRIPLLQGDFPLLARAVFKSLLVVKKSAPEKMNNNLNNPPIEKDMRNHLIFLLLDAIATMCADSAACRIAFTCCIPMITQILKGYVIDSSSNNNTPSCSSASDKQKQQQKKPPVSFVRPSSATNTANTSNNNNNNNNNEVEQQNPNQEPQTTDDDVVFAGAASLETMIFHCPESVESLVLENDGVSTLVALYRQASIQKQQREEKLAKKSSSSLSLSNPTDTIAFIKRTLIHLRTCGAISEDQWKNDIFSATNLVRVFGRQGENLAVDELKWNLTGGIKVFMRK